MNDNEMVNGIEKDKWTIDGASDAQLANVLRRLAENDSRLAERVNAELYEIRKQMESTAAQVQVATETNEKQFSPEELLSLLKERFENNMQRHKDIEWSKVQARLAVRNQKMRSLSEMEKSGGEPDVVGYDEKTEEYIFCDCSREAPYERRNVCYNRGGQEHAEKLGCNPRGNAIDMANEMGTELLTEEQYEELKKLDVFDLRTRVWIKSPLSDDSKDRYGLALSDGKIVEYWVNVLESKKLPKFGCRNRFGSSHVDHHDDSVSFRTVLKV